MENRLLRLGQERILVLFISFASGVANQISMSLAALTILGEIVSDY